MKSYIVTYTSTETLFDEEKQRRQNTLAIQSKDEGEVKQKAIDSLTATGRHSQIVIHSVQLEKRQPNKKFSLILMIAAVFLLVLVFQSFVK